MGDYLSVGVLVSNTYTMAEALRMDVWMTVVTMRVGAAVTVKMASPLADITVASEQNTLISYGCSTTASMG